MDKKVCIKCGEEKLISEFNKHTKYKSGIRNICKSCCSLEKKIWKNNNRDKIKEGNKIYRENNPDKIKEKKKIYRENNRDKIREKKKIYRENNRDKIREARKVYRENNRDKLKEESKRYRENNPDKIKEGRKRIPTNKLEEKIKNGCVCMKCHIRKDITEFYSFKTSSCKECEKLRMKEYREKFPNERKNTKLKYKKQKMENNPVYRVELAMRRRLKLYIKRKSFKNKNRFEDIIGVTTNDFRTYIESLFNEGMTWDNYGLYGWHIDHIIPLSSANTIEDLERLCYYTNLQPLWAKDNLSKSNKILPEFEHMVNDYIL
jgi:hypothetical protein